jgi:hypothetical protein
VYCWWREITLAALNLTHHAEASQFKFVDFASKIIECHRFHWQINQLGEHLSKQPEASKE